jgi:inosose dehydratase
MDDRIAGAPISWGVCEVPGWGMMLPAQRVFSEMRSLGLTATELGAPGFLPRDASELSTVLGHEGMTLLGGFVPLALHDPAQRAEALREAEATARLFQACGARWFVTAAVMDPGWSPPVPLDAAGMRRLAEGLREVDEVCERHGLTQVLHPHVDTLVETRADVELALEHTDVRWCLDTGHLAIGGVDPVRFAQDAAGRVAQVHLKDVDLSVAAAVRRRELSLLDGVRAGLFKPLGRGDVAIDEAVLALERAGYPGWYVLEQDTAITGEVPAEGTGPVVDVRTSLEYLHHDVAPRVSVVRSGNRGSFVEVQGVVEP